MVVSNNKSETFETAQIKTSTNKVQVVTASLYFPGVIGGLRHLKDDLNANAEFIRMADSFIEALVSRLVGP